MRSSLGHGTGSDDGRGPDIAHLLGSLGVRLLAVIAQGAVHVAQALLSRPGADTDV